MVHTLFCFFQNRNVNRLVFARIKSQIKKNQMSVVTCTGYEIYIKSNEENIAKNIHLVYIHLFMTSIKYNFIQI